MKKFSNYINGQMVAPVSGKYLDNINPATGAVYSQLPASGPADIEQAYQAAHRAFPEWAALSVAGRSKIMCTIADEIEAQLEELAMAETTDTGKPLWLSRKMDIPRAADNFRFFGHAITQFSSESHLQEGVALNYTRRGPIGVAGCISPWNLPLYLFTWKIAPALAAGNTVVAKPSELTPATASMLGEICQKAALPPGVLNIVHGLGADAGRAIVEHPGITAISFTGGTQTGKWIASAAAPLFKKLSLELGGKNPTIIFNDCNFDEAVETAIKSAFTNQGEICLCGSRMYVENEIFSRFQEEFLKRVHQLKVGDPLDDSSALGALISKGHFNKVLGYIKLAREEGGEILAGGEPSKIQGRCANGFFVEPTVIGGLGPDCRTNQEEIFGPVVTLQRFRGETEAIELANGTQYGLAANIWTNDLKKAHTVAHKLHYGIVWVNTWLLRDLRTPFGGMKNSGLGREGGLEALRFFTEPQNVCIKF